MGEAVVLALVIPIVLIGAGFEAWQIVKTGRELRARAKQKPISAYDIHRSRWIHTGDPAELDRMKDVYTLGDEDKCSGS
jgi:hypothetical protein